MLRGVFSSALILLMLSSVVRAEGASHLLEVVAIEYPPYTSEHLNGYGLAFESLNRVLGNAEKTGVFDVEPRFLPPARANLMISQGGWAASFYPPLESEPHYYRLVLDNKSIELGLFRIRVPRAQDKSVAAWPLLSEMTGRVAVGRQADPATLGLMSAMKYSDIELIAVDSLEQGFQLLAKGRVDYVFSEKVAGYLFADLLNDKRLDLEFSDQPIFTTTMGIWVNRHNPSGEKLYQSLKHFQPGQE